MTKVKTIDRQGGNALIEWIEDGLYQRSIVPQELVVEGQCEHPERGLPHGEDWAELVGDVSIDAGALANELRRRGIYTAEDLQQQHQAALGALQSITAPLMGVLIAKLKARRAQNFGGYNGNSEAG